MQIKPHPALTHLVKHYLVLSGPAVTNGRHRLFADGNTGLVFNLAQAKLGGQERGAWLYGQVETFYDLAITGNMQWIIVVLQPYGAHQLWRVPAYELTNQFFPAEDFFGRRLQDITEQLYEAGQLTAQISLLNQFLLQELAVFSDNDATVREAVKSIFQRDGQLTIKDLLSSLHVTERTLERKFKQHVGIGPKRYAEIVKMNAAAKRLQLKRTAWPASPAKAVTSTRRTASARLKSMQVLRPRNITPSHIPWR
ncbi:hypothetical protein MKQ70_20545 [Chitinophaga sedimenti]|nr:DUF6597 domain-containing transcriptional factor [Chitinophaga sedimenti]MCK7557263.1 hypothetical protein [Chitinophaga sedimenti]